jgi:hypothetical protein
MKEWQKKSLLIIFSLSSLFYQSPSFIYLLFCFMVWILSVTQRFKSLGPQCNSVHEGSDLMNRLIHLWIQNVMGYWEVVKMLGLA